MTELEAMVRMLADRQAIRDCLATYCRGVDRLDRELLISVYHDDAVDDHGVFVGSREEFADWALAHHARHQNATQHIITNHTCELDGDVAHTETYWMMAAMNKQGAPLNLSGGRYIDRFERRNGRWAIALRKCLGEWRGIPGEPHLSPEGAKALNSGAPPTRDRNDPSYDRPLAFDESRRGYSFF
jgi:ketosteroid isomerase-like protein